MNFANPKFYGRLFLMKAFGILILALSIALPQLATAQRERKSLLDSDPNVVYLNQVLKDPVKLTVIKEAPVFSDFDGRQRLGILRAGQDVEVEAITDRVYRVRGRGARDGIAGWVAPWAFSSSNPDFVEVLKKFYEREMAVKALIDEGRIAIGMTLDEVKRCKGEPTKTSMRKTEDGQATQWEFIDYDEIRHYVTHIDPYTRQTYRTLSHITQEERGKLTVEFENGTVTAIEETRDDRRGNVRIIVPPIVFGW
jgi:hypothetical protein